MKRSISVARSTEEDDDDDDKYEFCANVFIKRRTKTMFVDDAFSWFVVCLLRVIYFLLEEYR